MQFIIHNSAIAAPSAYEQNTCRFEEILNSGNENAIRDCLQEIFDKNSVRIKIDSIKKAESSEHRVFEINNSWILRFSPDVCKLQREFLVLKTLLLYQPSLPIPHFFPMYCIPEERIVFVIYKKLIGDPLSNARYLQLSDGEKAKLADDIATVLCHIHRTSALSCYLPCETEELLSGIMPRVPLPQVLNAKMEKYLQSTEYQDLMPLWKKVYGIYLTTYEDDAYFFPIHNDLNQNNLLIEKDRLSGVIDFSDMVVGHVAREFRHLFSIDPRFMILVVAAYAKNCHFDEKGLIQKAFAFRLYRDFTNLWKVIEYPHIASKGDFESAATLRRFLHSFRDLSRKLDGCEMEFEIGSSKTQ